MPEHVRTEVADPGAGLQALEELADRVADEWAGATTAAGTTTAAGIRAANAAAARVATAKASLGRCPSLADERRDHGKRFPAEQVRAQRP